METPVLYIAYNRPHISAKSFDVLRKNNIRNLYVAIDGPRHELDKIKVGTVVKICQNIDWDCNVKYLIRDQNLGCGKGVSGAIDWFFTQVDAGIILEDDVIPNNSFFQFTTSMLKKYKSDETIMAITGRNVAAKWGCDADYFFTSTLNVWGWATWKRAWANFDFDMKDYPLVKQKKSFISDKPVSFKKKCLKGYDKMFNHELDTWDYQWDYALRKNNGLTIVPKVNLVSNIGFGSDATHTKVSNKELEELETFELDKMYTHPTKIVEDYDYFTYFLSLNKSSFYSLVKNGIQILFKDPKSFFRLVRERL